MTDPSSTNESITEKRTLKTLLDTPFKRIMLLFQILSYVLIVFSPLIGGGIGKLVHLNAGKTGALILGIFITGEILFYGSLFFLGKEIVLLIREKIKSWFKRKSTSKPENHD